MKNGQKVLKTSKPMTKTMTLRVGTLSIINATVLFLIGLSVL